MNAVSGTCGTYRIDESAARSLLRAMGFRHASVISPGRVHYLLNRIGSLASEADDLSGTDLALFRNVSAALESGDGVEVVEYLPNAADAKPGASESTPGARPRRPRRKKNLPPVRRDRFGATLGSDRARIGAALDATPKTPGEISRESGVDLEGNLRHYLRRLVDRGLVTRDADGKYRVRDGNKEEGGGPF